MENINLYRINEDDKRYYKIHGLCGIKNDFQYYSYYGLDRSELIEDTQESISNLRRLLKMLIEVL